MMDPITDIWFYTALPLIELGETLGLSGVDLDGENYWEWIIGDLDGLALDITRTHTIPVADTPTRIFRVGEQQVFTPDLVDVLAERIKAAGIAPIMIGSWIYRSGNTYDMRIDRTLG